MYRFVRLLLCCILLLPCGLRADTLLLASGDWPPYAGAGLGYEGVGERIVREAFARQGVTVRYLYRPWMAGHRLAKAGKVAGTILWSASPDQDADFLTSQPILDSEIVLFYRKGLALNPADPLTARGVRFAYPEGYDYELIPALQAMLEVSGQRAVVLDGDEACIEALLNQRIDAVPLDRRVGVSLLLQEANMGRAGLVAAPSAQLAVHPLSILISRKTPGATERLQQFHQGLASLRESGLLDLWLQDIQPAHKPVRQGIKESLRQK